MAFLIWGGDQAYKSYQFNATPTLLQKKRQHTTTFKNSDFNCEKNLTGLTSPHELVNCRAKPKSSIKHFLQVLGKRPIAKFD